MPSGGLVGVGVAALLALTAALSAPAVARATPEQLYAFGYESLALAFVVLR
jgi:hypothetical protein